MSVSGASDAPGDPIAAVLNRVRTALGEELDAALTRVTDLEGQRARQDQEAGQRLEDALTQQAMLEAELASLRHQLEAADRLPVALESLDEATTLRAVLDELVCLASREATRAAVFLVKGDRVYDWRAQGFGDALRPGLEVGVEEQHLVGEAVRTRTAAQHWAGEGALLPAFVDQTEPRLAAALPVIVGGAVIAVLYADTVLAREAPRPRWPAMLEVAVRYAGRVLEGLTIRQAASLWGVKPARERATSL